MTRVRVDGNQAATAKILRKKKMSVQILSSIKHGCPDLLIGAAGVNLVVELKSTPHLWLTDDERGWHDRWKGTVVTAKTADAIIDFFIQHVKHVRDNGDQIIEELERIRNG